MRYVPDSSPRELDELSLSECLRLLEQHSIGRIAVVVDGQPQIFPVNYSISGRVIAVRTARGTKLIYAPGSKVSFEIDEFDPATGISWSVMVQGTGVDATSANDDVSWASRGADPHPLAPGLRPHRIAIDPSQITGRRFQHVWSAE